MYSMKILLLGSSGFIGKNFSEYIAPYGAYRLYTPGRSELDLLNGSEVEKYLEQLQPDVVVHAAVCRNPKYFPASSPLPELEQDLRMFYNLERCSHLFGKMLYFGSGAEYDKTRDIVSVSETDGGNGVPGNSYGLAKYVIGKEIEHSRNIYNLRVFGLFGKYENWRTTFISGACCKVVKKLPITIRQNVLFDYMYIDDFCKIIQWFIDHTPLFHTYNITTGRKNDLLSIANMIKEVAQADVPIYVCRTGVANEYTAKNDRLISEVRDITFTDLNNAIADLLQYYRGIEDQIDMMSLLYQ